MAAPIVLLVPGTGGSELSTPPSFFGLGPNIRVWLNYGALVSGAWAWLALKPDGVTPSFPGVGVLIPGAPLGSYYGTWCVQMLARGWDVRSASLDWRGTIDRDATRLVSAIRAIASNGPICIVAHSRGGLVLRQALNLLSDAGQLGLVGRCAGLGVPQQGSWDSASLLSGFQHSQNNLRVLVSLNPGIGVVPVISDGVRTMCRTWPIGYELLPMPGATGADPESIAACYDPSKWSAINVNVSPAWLTESSTRWETARAIPSAVEWCDVVGVGLSTPDQLGGGLPPSGPLSYTYTTAGDGTILARWATTAGHVRITSPTSHGALMYDGRLINVLNSYLRNGLDSDVTISGPVLR